RKIPLEAFAAYGDTGPLVRGVGGIGSDRRRPRKSSLCPGPRQGGAHCRRQNNQATEDPLTGCHARRFLGVRHHSPALAIAVQSVATVLHVTRKRVIAFVIPGRSA